MTRSPMGPSSYPLPPPPSGSPIGATEAGLIGAILATCFCCQPLGIVAIVFAVLAMAAQHRRRGEEYARQSRQWTTWAVVAGLAWGFVVLLFALIGSMSH